LRSQGKRALAFFLSKHLEFKLFIIYLSKPKYLKVMQNQQEMFTPEQIEEKKAELMEFYKEQIEVLQLQKDYETLATEIEELRARRLVAQMRQAQIMAPRPEEGDDAPETPEETEEIKKRVLRKEK
jgi:hypothetical protein